MTANPEHAQATMSPSMESLWNDALGFVREVGSLDPEQAAIRSGLSVLVVVAALLVIWGLRTILNALIKRLANGEEAVGGKRVEIGRWSMRVARAVIGLAAIVVILDVWGLSLESMREGPLGAFIAAAIRIAIVLALAFAAMELLQVGIHRMFGGIAKRARNARRAAQVRTLAPLMTGVATTTIFLLAAMMTLSEIGIEIGPLIAGAGIVGLAVGFGAQTLVKDFLTGVFLIVEDTVSIGDIVKIGDASGVVEGMSLRTIKLRNLDGTLHVIPYGEAQIVNNMTKDFACYVFDLSIAYSADVVKALQVLKDTGEALARDEEFGPRILAPMDVFGVDQLADSGVILKARVRTLPGEQWSVGREFLKRIKLAFDEAGIEIPFPHLKISADDPFKIISAPAS
jgi:small conductance mechanosensitive channel